MPRPSTGLRELPSAMHISELHPIKARLRQLRARLHAARDNFAAGSSTMGIQQGAADALLQEGAATLSEMLLGKRTPLKRLATQVSTENRNRVNQARESEIRRETLTIAAEAKEMVDALESVVEPRTLRKWEKIFHQLCNSPPSRTKTIIDRTDRTIVEITGHIQLVERSEQGAGRSEPGPTAKSPNPRERAWQERVVAELATVFHDRELAVTLLTAAGFPAARIPDFRVPLVFWASVMSELRKGLLRQGIRPVLDQAMKLYPGNPTFAEARRSPFYSAGSP